MGKQREEQKHSSSLQREEEWQTVSRLLSQCDDKEAVLLSTLLTKEKHMVNLGITDMGNSYFYTKDGPYTWMIHDKPKYVTGIWRLLFLAYGSLGGEKIEQKTRWRVDA